MGSPGRGTGAAVVAGQVQSPRPGRAGSWTEGYPMGGPAQEMAAGCAPDWQDVSGAWTWKVVQKGPTRLCVPVSP